MARPRVERLEALELLYHLRLLLTETTWTSGAVARDEVGEAIHPLHDRAVAWCLLGAIGRVSWAGVEDAARCELRYDTLVQTLIAVEPCLFVRSLPTYNDQEGVEAVRSLVDIAIGAVEFQVRGKT